MLKLSLADESRVSLKDLCGLELELLLQLTEHVRSHLQPAVQFIGTLSSLAVHLDRSDQAAGIDQLV